MVANGSMNLDGIDFDENLTFQQIINEYNDNSTFLDNSSNISNHTIDATRNDIDIIDLSSVENNDRDTHPFSSGEDICLTDRTTRSLR